MASRTGPFFSWTPMKQYNYNEIPDSEFSHKHNPMAMYDENPLAIGSCWGLEVEMFDRIERKWLRLDDFPNPGYF